MSQSKPYLRANIAAVRARIDAAAFAAGRDPSDVRLLLATKTQPAERILAAVSELAASGWFREPQPPAVLLGENRVQELIAKADAYAELVAARRAEVHLIGPLQRNKINNALRVASAIQSVDSLALAQAISSRVSPDAPVDVMVQVNVSGEASKSGISPDDAVALARETAALPGLRLIGFMTIGAPLEFPVVEPVETAALNLSMTLPAALDPTAESIARARSGYATLRQIREELRAAGHPGTEHAQELSMGMSDDLEHAIAEGATIVRVGSAIFGPRIT